MKPTPLCKLAYKYGTDKCPQIRHSFTPIYYDLFKDRVKSIKKVLEVGIGQNKEFKNKDVIYTRPNPHNKSLKVQYHKGASLKMWRDFFPNAQVYGADIVPESLFEDERIKTFLCDERKKEDLEKLIENTGSDIDIFIDDASHRPSNQIFMAKTLLPLLKKDVVYIIEDVAFSGRLKLALSQYDCSLPDPSSKYKLLIVKKKDKKISEGIKHKGSPYEIPDCSRHDLPAFFKEIGYKVGLEIGVYKGRFTRGFCEVGLKMYAIDYWTPYPGFDRIEPARIERQEYLYHQTRKFLSRYKNATVIRKTSMKALKDFEDESLDFVYIDGNHILKYVVEDIDGWSKKVRKGGVVAGHDYIHPNDYEERKQNWAWKNIQVKFAVDAYIQANRIKNWYLIGQDKDRFPSWFWIK